MTVTLADLLKDSAYRLDQFKPEHISALEAGVTLQQAGKVAAPYATCLARGKPIKLMLEEALRQLYLRALYLDVGNPIARMTVEYEVTLGREKKRADICIFDKDTRLLDAAKRAVEIAIKDSEGAALAHVATANPLAAAV